MSVVSCNSKLINELIEAGIIPPRCYRWTMTATVQDVVRLAFEVFVTDEEFQKIVAAVKEHHAETEVRTMVINEIPHQTVDVSAFGDKL